MTAAARKRPVDTRRVGLFGLATLLSVYATACGGGGGGGAEVMQTVAPGQITVPAQADTPAQTAVPEQIDVPMQTGESAQTIQQSPLAASPTQRVGIGIGGLSYYDRSFAMADVGRQAQLRGLDWSYEVAADANGNPGKDFQLIFSSTKIAAGTYKLVFNGRATVTVGGGAGSVQNVSYDAVSNTSKADVILGNDVVGNVWLVIKDTYRTGTAAKGSGVSGIRLWRPGYATDGSALFTNEFLTAMRKFKLIRGMDFVSANTNPQRIWSERTRPNFFGHPGDNGQSWELLVALANAADRDVWLNLPVRADDDYIRKLAQLVKYGSDGNMPYTSVQANPAYPPLKPGLRVYVEYGNEVWNSGPGFKGFGWALALANANRGDVAHPIAFDGVQIEQYLALRRWIAYRSSFISLAFRDVFGDGAMMGTVRPILGSQSGNANSYLSTGLTWAQAFYGQVRTTGAVNAVVRKPSDIWYGGGGAAYYDSAINPADTSAGTLNAYFANLPTPTFASVSAIDSIWTHGYGLKYVAYEGGPGPGGHPLGGTSGGAVAPVFNNDSRMKARMLSAQDIWDRAGGDEMVFYIYSSTAPWSFTNELSPKTVSDTNSVKLQAVDAINAKAKPAATLGKAVPSTIYLKDPASQTIGADGAAGILNGTVYRLRPGSNQYVLLPLRTATAGTYRISLNIDGTVSGSVAVHVNGALSGTINIGANASDTGAPSSKVAMSLPAGLSVLRLDSPKGSADILVKDVVIE